MASFDPDRLVSDCLAAVRSDAPVDALREVLAAATTDPIGVDRALGTTVGGDMGFLHVSEHLVLQRAILPLGYSTGLHEHRLWTLSAVYAGAEAHDLHRVVGNALVPLGSRTITAGDIEILAPDVAHSSTAVGDEHLRAFHVYVGDLFASGAGEWDDAGARRRPFDDAWLERLLAALGTAELLAA